MSESAAEEHLVAYIWWCGDYDCDCVQPRIDRITPHEDGYRWNRCETIWEGTYVSLASGYPEDVTYETLEDELRSACQEYGIESGRC